MLQGTPPFNAATDDEIEQLIKKGKIHYDNSIWDAISPQAKDLVQKMLTANPAKRPTAQECLNHPWIQLGQRNISKRESFEILGNISDYQAGNKFVLFFKEFITSQLSSSQEIKKLGEIFKQIDLDNNGLLSYDEIQQAYNSESVNLNIDPQQIFQQCDSDGNGVVDFNEFITACLDWNTFMSKQKIHELFSTFDLDNSGEISVKELKQHLTDDLKPFVQELFDEYDLNNDGKLDIDEFTNGILKSLRDKLGEVRRITLKAADIEKEPPTPEEINQLRNLLKKIQEEQKTAKHVDYNLYNKNQLIDILKMRDEEHRKAETLYRAQIDELDCALYDARERIISLLDELTESDDKLMESRKDRRKIKEQLSEVESQNREIQITLQDLQHDLQLAHREIQRQEATAEEDLQKIDVLNTHIRTLQRGLNSEKENSASLSAKLDHANNEIENNKSVIKAQHKEIKRLKQIENDYNSVPTDQAAIHALEQLSLIIVSKDKSNLLDSQTEHIIKRVFGQDCIQIINMYDNKINHLMEHYNQEIQTLNLKILSLKQQLHRALKDLGTEDLSLSIDSQYHTPSEKLRKLQDLELSMQKDLESIPQSNYSIGASMQPLYGLSSYSEPKDIGIQANSEFESHDVIESGMLSFLKCEAAALEEVLNSQFSASISVDTFNY